MNDQPTPAQVYAEADTSDLAKRVLDALPGLIGGIDHAIRDQMQLPHGLPFVLMIFTQDAALHAANFNPNAAKEAIIKVAGTFADEAALSQMEAMRDAPESPAEDTYENREIPVRGQVPAINGSDSGPDPDEPRDDTPPHVTH